LSQYQAIVPYVQLSGPTSFAPIIRQSIEIVRATAQYHILVVVTDGQVDNPEIDAQAIIEASNYPLSIVVVGVGDGPWKAMHEFDDGLPARRFDNFQFVEFNKMLSARVENPELHFAVHALMEVPEQYKLIKKLGLLSKVQAEQPSFRPTVFPEKPPLPFVNPPLAPAQFLQPMVPLPMMGQM